MASDATADLSHSHELDGEIRRLFRLASIVTILLFGGVGGWASLATINGAVIAAGTIAVEGKHKAVQHLDGGTIARIHVRDGTQVEAGTVLLTLDGRELDTEVAGLGSEIAARSRQIELIEADLVGLLELQEKKLVPNHRVTVLQREAAALAGEIARLSNQRSKAEARRARIEIKAPAAGRVHNLLTHTVGGVIAPGSTIAEIVPSGDPLVVEARVAPGDVDQVRTGQAASVRMTSFSQRSTPAVDGRVESVSADLLRDETKGAAYYLARIVLAASTESRLGGKALVPGMPAEVLIETDRRSAMSYLTKPLTDQIMRAFREE